MSHKEISNLKKQIVHLLILFTFFSCTTEANKSCIEKSYPNVIPSLKKSYQKFLKTNKFGSTNDLLKTYEDTGEGPIMELIFDNDDKILFQELCGVDFFEYAYEKIDFNNYWMELPSDQRQEMIDKAQSENPNPYAFNVNSQFSMCIKEMAQKDSVAYYYLNLISRIGIPSPAVLSGGLLSMSKMNEYNQETIEWITIMNFYYPLLKNEFEE